MVDLILDGDSSEVAQGQRVDLLVAGCTICLIDRRVVLHDLRSHETARYHLTPFLVQIANIFWVVAAKLCRAESFHHRRVYGQQLLKP